MSRNHRSARQAGTAFETLIKTHLRAAAGDDSIERMPRMGAKDCGDIANVKIGGHKIAIECKDCSKIDLPTWTKEAKREAHNYGALAGMVVFKRRGTTDPSKQWVAMTVAELVALITGEPEGVADVD